MSEGARQIRIVVCDDAPECCELTCLRLERDPSLTVVGTADDGEAAVELISQLRPDVVLLDLAMPNVDGFEALPRLREVAPEARVIVLSGLSASQVAAKVLALGADRYLEKGESGERLREAVYEVAV